MTTSKAAAGAESRRAGDVGGALAAGTDACVAGALDLGRAVAGIGREVLREAADHVGACVRAGSLRELAELQAAWAQHRVEMSATHAKEIADLARARTEQVIAPMVALLKQDKTA